MEYDFYQKINYFGKSTLKFVGKAYVPDNRPRWDFAPKPEVSLAFKKDILTTPPSSLYERISYERIKTISGIIYVANVSPSVKIN